MLKDQPRREVCEFASYSQQMRSLQLRPWQFPPCWLSLGDSNPEHAAAVVLVKRLFDAGLLRYEPDPIKALQGTEPPRAA
jgi:hypothetical protein